MPSSFHYDLSESGFENMDFTPCNADALQPRIRYIPGSVTFTVSGKAAEAWWAEVEKQGHVEVFEKRRFVAHFKRPMLMWTEDGPTWIDAYLGPFPVGDLR